MFSFLFGLNSDSAFSISSSFNQNWLHIMRKTFKNSSLKQMRLIEAYSLNKGCNSLLVVETSTLMNYFKAIFSFYHTIDCFNCSTRLRRRLFPTSEGFQSKWKWIISTYINVNKSDACRCESQVERWRCAVCIIRLDRI